MELLTISEAAEATGLSKAAVARRIERGTLRSLKRDGLRRVLRSDLERAGLVVDGVAATGHVRHRGNHDVIAATIADLTSRLERQAFELGRMRALTVEAESLKAERDRLEQQVFEMHARVLELEGQLGRRKGRFGWIRRRAGTLAAHT